MKRTATKGDEPLSMFALIVIGLEMLTVAGVIWYACTEAGNVGHAPTWFGERVPVASSLDTVDPARAEGEVRDCPKRLRARHAPEAAGAVWRST